ncbi:hypothetical protein [Bacillus cabrialesii]
MEEIEECTQLRSSRKMNLNVTGLFIVRKFKLISSHEVTNYTVNYLENNPNIKNENILQLAWGQTEEKQMLY